MASEMVFVLSCPPDAATRLDIEDFAVSVCDEARKRGWKVWACWTDAGLKVRLQNGRVQLLREFVATFVNSATKHGATMSVLEKPQPATLIRDIEDGPIVWGTVIHARLTRRLLCALPEGALVAFNLTAGDRGRFIGRVGSFQTRGEQWKRAQLAGLDGGSCRVLWSEDDCHAFYVRPLRSEASESA